MKKVILIGYLFAIVTVSVYAQQYSTEFPKLKGPYLGQKPPGMKAELFAPGAISLPGSTEWSSCFSPDGNEFYFYRVTRVSDKPDIKIFGTKQVDGIWKVPEEAKFASGYPSSQPHVTRDNMRLYFGWHRPVPHGEPDYMGDIGIWMAVRTNKGWSEPRYAGQGMFVSSSNDGRIYTTDMSTRMINGKTYLAKVRIENERFVGFERLQIEPEFPEGPTHPCIAPDGSYILFDVAGGSHMFVSFKQEDGTWGRAIDLTDHGFDQQAGGATITPDGKYLFFHLNGDLWWVDIKIIEELRPKE
ncbi:MAG: hypothetical protein A2161_10650 [Candidatus Schekmanbacteria bacterium RBG_13_48_7]|uniref:Uncharacterized protein n=1 Tax=Candidatus Schekmanbacteria bacterium RBG_13_48_7 TaxID=1817878 RepID=A0A1F7RU78_9BACT|nr:MAG: hypothetical protein A2161_10650 [Candidatus Schekmanbacteria bacterium RBG_13_48_7]